MTDAQGRNTRQVGKEWVCFEVADGGLKICRIIVETTHTGLVESIIPCRDDGLVPRSLWVIQPVRRLRGCRVHCLLWRACTRANESKRVVLEETATH